MTVGSIRSLWRFPVKQELPGAGHIPCAGVYAVVQRPGTLRVGDAVALAGA